MMQAHIFVSGYVQGVWYRKFVKTNAVKLGLTGWVRNLPDNRVEAVFQPSAGSGQEGKEKVEQLIKLCHDGSLMAEVSKVDFEWEDADEECMEFMII